MRKLLRFTSFLIVLFVYGCSTPLQTTFDQPIYHNKPLKQRQVLVSNQQSWNINGAVGIQQNGKAQIGTFTWQQNRNNYLINIYGPLNFGRIAIQGMPGRVTIFKPNGTYSARTPEELMRQQLGWYLPISNMFFWVRGLPAPGPITRQTQDNYGHLVYLQQQGWTIQFQEFTSQNNVDLPRKIIFDNQRLRVKMVIKNWTLY